LYKQLCRSFGDRKKAYRQLSRTHIADITLEEIRKATNNARVLGNNRFKKKIEELTARQATPKAKEGDRRPGDYQKSQTNRVCPNGIC